MASRFVLPFADVGSGILPSSGALLYFYETGTSTPKDTYTDAGEGTANSNPVVSDSKGVFPAIFISGTYKVVLKDKDLTQKWEEDDIVAVSGAVQSDTIATLRARSSAADIVWVSGYHIKDDGAFGSNFFRWNPTSTDADNDGTIIKITSVVTGRYELQYTSAVSFKWFGAVGDGVTDDRAAIQKALNLTTATEYSMGQGNTYYLNSFTTDPAHVITDHPIYLYLERSNVAINGCGSSFKLGANSDDGNFVMLTNWNDHISNIRLDGIKFEGNFANNNSRTEYRSIRAAIRLNFTQGSYITNCIFEDFDSIHVIFHGSNLFPSYSGAYIDNCIFRDVALGQSQVGVQDHTSIYMLTQDSSITNCQFINTDVGGIGVLDAGTYANTMEFHTSNSIYSGNTVTGYLRAFIIAPMENPDIYNIRIHDNYFKTTSYCGGFDYNDEGCIFDNIHINDNAFIIDTTGYVVGDFVIAYLASAIVVANRGFVIGANVSGLYFTDNTFECINPASTEFAIGVHVNENNLDGMYIKNNVFRSADILQGVRIINAGANPHDCKNVEISSNTFEFPVSIVAGAEAITISDGKVASTLQNLTIKNNTLNTATTGIPYTMRVFYNISATISGLLLEGLEHTNKTPDIGISLDPHMMNVAKFSFNIKTGVSLVVPSITGRITDFAELTFTTYVYPSIYAKYELIQAVVPLVYKIATVSSGNDSFPPGFLIFNDTAGLSTGASYPGIILKISNF